MRENGKMTTFSNHQWNIPAAMNTELTKNVSPVFEEVAFWFKLAQSLFSIR